MSTNKDLSPVVILDITYSGYGIMRSLYPYKIPLYGFTYSAKHLEVNTRLAKEVIIYKSTETDLKDKLIQLALRLPKRPVLFLTNDEKVEFVLNHYDALNEHYFINMPSVHLTAMLIDKIKLNTLINKLCIRTPKTVNIESIGDFEGVKDLRFPVIIKPFLKSEKWYNAGFSKAIIFDSLEDLETTFSKLFACENRLIIQEFIPGGDDAVYYCLVYYNANGECKTHFTGQKIRQWRILKGSTTSTKPANAPYVTKETLRIFDAINYKGLGSIEFKKHGITNEYYMIEPTVGRVDTQEYIATCAGNNIPLKAYCDMTGHSIAGKEKPNDNVVFFDEQNELLSFIEYNKNHGLTVKQWYQSVKGKKYYRYLKSKDTGLSLKIALLLVRRISGYFIRRLLKL